jgi:hypothetical protein
LAVGEDNLDFTVSIGTLLKIAGIAIGTYVLLPLFLVVRDYLLWKIIDRFIITEELLHKISLYSNYLVQWNNNYVGKASIQKTPETVRYSINEEEVSEREWNEYRKNRDQLQDQMNKTIWFIQRRSNLVTWLLKHYKQDSDNPIKKMSDAYNLRAKETYEAENS